MNRHYFPTKKARVPRHLNGSFCVELGYRSLKNLGLSLGYSFGRFAADLTGDDYRGGGPYLKLRFKFDEDTFKRGEGKSTH